ncbi:MAG TPA: DUF6714 family protein [Phycisphaerales bacterium]|nr:DUF6714 family protein [Phycisphaerales bacterium]
MEARRQELIALVLQAFKDVTREGGVSWSQTFVMDDYGSDAELAQAAARDRELDWIELSRQGPWNYEYAMWGFLDAISARYYLAASLLLDLETGRSAHPDLLLTYGPQKESWSLLDDHQRAVVAMYMRWKRDIAGLEQSRMEHRNWTRALQAGWDQYPPPDSK